MRRRVETTNESNDVTFLGEIACTGCGLKVQMLSEITLFPQTEMFIIDMNLHTARFNKTKKRKGKD